MQHQQYQLTYWLSQLYADICRPARKDPICAPRYAKRAEPQTWPTKKVELSTLRMPLCTFAAISIPLEWFPMYTRNPTQQTTYKLDTFQTLPQAPPPSYGCVQESIHSIVVQQNQPCTTQLGHGHAASAVSESWTTPLRCTAGAGQDFHPIQHQPTHITSGITRVTTVHCQHEPSNFIQKCPTASPFPVRACHYPHNAIKTYIQATHQRWMKLTKERLQG
jgi:hypothetical protein